MEKPTKTNRFINAENLLAEPLQKKEINISAIAQMANEIEQENKPINLPIGEGSEPQKLKGLTIKLTEKEYRLMYKRKLEISTDLTVQDYVANLIRKDLKDNNLV